MVAGLRQVFCAAVAISCIALALPALALAHGTGKCDASACKVYVEPNVPSAGKQQATQSPQSPPPTSSEGDGGSGGQTHKPSKLLRVLAQAGNDKVPLSRLLNGSGVDPLKGGPDSVAGPGLIGAALDLGLGPLALLAILLVSAGALVAYGVMQNRQRQRPSA
jgi:hypothetical protein